MNCPNCGEKPVGMLPSLTFGGVGFKKALRGYFKCKHCGTLLKQSTTSSMVVPKYKSPFWVFYTFLMVGFIGTIWFIYYLLEMNLGEQNIWLVIPAVLVIGLIFFLAMDALKTRYWIIEETEYEEEIPESQKLSTTGMTLFIGYAIVSIASFLFLNNIVDAASLSPALYTIGAIIYMVLIFGGAIYIINEFSGRKSDEPTE